MRRLVVAKLVTLEGATEARGGEPGHPHSGWASAFASSMSSARPATHTRELVAAVPPPDPTTSAPVAPMARSSLASDADRSDPKLPARFGTLGFADHNRQVRRALRQEVYALHAMNETR